jgi:hypothetical protein
VGSSIQRALSNPGLLHASLALSACQLAWVFGSLNDSLRVPFYYHKQVTYAFVKEQLLDPEKAISDSTLWAVAILAVTEVCQAHQLTFQARNSNPFKGSIGDLDSASKHLMGIRQLVNARPPSKTTSGLPQRMLEM